MKENKNKFSKELSHDEINLIETIAEKEMQFFGYDFVTDRNWKYPLNFQIKLQKERAEKKKAIKKTFGELENKINYINEIRNKRKKEWELNNNSTLTQNSIKKPSKKSRIKKRIKLLSLALLGEKATQSISRHIRT